LETAARVVRDQLVADGEPVNRRNLADGLRSAGHRVRNDRLGHLLQVVSAADHEAAVPVGVVRHCALHAPFARTHTCRDCS
jgi:hypothetical protein